MIIDLPPKTEQLLIQTAQNQGVSIADLIERLLNPNPMIQKALSIKNPSALGNGLKIQQELRNEWD